MPDTTSELFEVRLDQPTPSKFERERGAFLRLLPQLLVTHPGQYVAIHDEQIADSGTDRLEVAMRVLRRVGNVDIYVGLAADQPEPVCRSGVRRDLSRKDLRQ
jgi:hypothetical protein